MYNLVICHSNDAERRLTTVVLAVAQPKMWNASQVGASVAIRLVLRTDMMVRTVQLVLAFFAVSKAVAHVVGVDATAIRLAGELVSVALGRSVLTMLFVRPIRTIGSSIAKKFFVDANCIATTELSVLAILQVTVLLVSAVSTIVLTITNPLHWNALSILALKLSLVVGAHLGIAMHLILLVGTVVLVVASPGIGHALTLSATEQSLHTVGLGAIMLVRIVATVVHLIALPEANDALAIVALEVVHWTFRFTSILIRVVVTVLVTIASP